MSIFEERNEKNKHELEELLKLVNRQNSIYSLRYDVEKKELNYRIVYDLDNISERTIKLTDEEIENQLMLKLIEIILLRFSFLRRKTRENINKQLIKEYINKLPTNRRPLDIVDEIDKNALLERIKERKNDITHYVDSEIAIRVLLTTLENMTVTGIVNLIDQSITKYLLTYTFVAPFIYSYVPYKIDNIKNTIKYNRVVSSLENEEYKPKPNLKLFCIVNKKVHDLETEDSKLYENEIKELQDIMEECYTNGSLEKDTIDLKIVEHLEEVYSRIELKKLNRNTISFTEYLARKQQDKAEREEKKSKAK